MSVGNFIYMIGSSYQIRATYLGDPWAKLWKPVAFDTVNNLLVENSDKITKLITSFGRFMFGLGYVAGMARENGKAVFIDEQRDEIRMHSYRKSSG